MKGTGVVHQRVRLEMCLFRCHIPIHYITSPYIVYHLPYTLIPYITSPYIVYPLPYTSHPLHYFTLHPISSAIYLSSITLLHLTSYILCHIPPIHCIISPYVVYPLLYNSHILHYFTLYRISSTIYLSSLTLLHLTSYILCHITLIPNITSPYIVYPLLFNSHILHYFTLYRMSSTI